MMNKDTVDVKSHIFAEIQDTARPVGILWAIPQIILTIIFGFVVMLIFVVVGALASIAVAQSMGIDVSAIDQENPPGWLLAVIIPFAIGALFGGWALGAIIKTKMEKRSLKSIGLDGFLYGGRFWGGFLGGIVLAIALTIPAVFFGSVFEGDLPTSFDWGRLGDTPFIVAMAVLFIALMIQAPSEEIIFRGWLFSGISARHGLGIGVIVSALFFGLAHGDRIVAGFPLGFYYIMATAGLGFLFAGLARKARSVIPAAGMHTGYNFTLLGIGMSALYASSSDGDLMGIVSQLMDVSQIESPPMDMAYWRELGIRVGLPVIVGLWLLSTSKSQDS